MPKDQQGKILYTTSSASPQSGATRKLFQMSKGMKGCGWITIHVLPADIRGLYSPENGGGSYYHNLPDIKRDQGLPGYIRFVFDTLRAAMQLVSIIKREAVDIVHINEVTDIYAGLATALTSAQCIWHIRANFSEWPLVSRILPRIVRVLSNLIIVVSNSVKEHFFRSQDVSGDKIKVIYDQGPDPARFHPGASTDAIREELGIPSEAKIVALVAKLSERKGHDVFLRAARKVLVRFPETYFLVVGGELEGTHHQRYANRLHALPRNLSIQDRVLFTGYRSDVPEIMAASDIITHCSVYPDPFPGVVLEGMVVGKPVVASDIGGPREQLEDGVSGVLVEPGEPVILADALCDLLDDEEKRKRLGRNARQRVQSEFTVDAFNQRLSRLYQQVLT